MIGHLRGTVLWKQPQEVVLDVAGVGYRLTIPVSTFCRLGEPGSPASLRVHTHVREDALALFGFASEAEHILFERLIGVVGVGPRLAVNILSGIEAADLTDAIRRGDVVRLTRVPGVGKKTAERLIVELKDKLPDALPWPAHPPAVHRDRDDLVSTLVHLGYPRHDAEKATDRTLADHPEARIADLLRHALRHLSR